MKTIIHGFRFMMLDFSRLRTICCWDTTLMLQQLLQFHYGQQCSCKRRRPKQCLNKSPALCGLSLPFPGKLGAVAGRHTAVVHARRGQWLVFLLGLLVGSGLVSVSFVVSGTWFGVIGSECLMQSSEQSLFTDHMNACTVFPFKLTVSCCQRGDRQPAEIWGFFSFFIPTLV